MRNWSEAHTEVLNGSMLLLLGIVIWTYSGTFPDLQEGYPGPALFPRLIALLFSIAGLVLLGTYIPKLSASIDSKNKEEQVGEMAPNRKYLLGGGIATIALFPLFSDRMGFLLTLGISVFIMALLLKIPLLKSALIALGTLGTIYLTFNVLLGVPL